VYPWEAIDEKARDRYFGLAESSAETVALLAKAAFEFLQSGPMAHWCEAVGEDVASAFAHPRPRATWENSYEIQPP
jgi:hypothetical protein